MVGCTSNTVGVSSGWDYTLEDSCPFFKTKKVNKILSVRGEAVGTVHWGIRRRYDHSIVQIVIDSLPFQTHLAPIYLTG